MEKYTVTYEEYIGEHRAFFVSYFKGFGVKLDELEKQNVTFVEIHVEDKNEHAAVIFLNDEMHPLTAKVHDDWYSIKTTDFRTIVSA